MIEDQNEPGRSAEGVKEGKKERENPPTLFSSQ